MHARNNIFQKKNSRYEILNRLFFWSKFRFLGTALGRFSQCFSSNFSSSANHGGRHFYSALLPPPHTHTYTHTHAIKQLSMTLALYNLWDMFLHGELLENIWVGLGLKLGKCLLDWCYQYSFLRLFVPRMFTNLNMNDNNGKIRLAKKKALNYRKIPILFSKFLFWKNFGFSFWIQAWNFSKCSKNRLPRSWG